PALPALAELVDGVRVAEWLAPLVETDLDVVPRYARYKALNKATVLYDVAAGGRRTAVVVTVAALRDLRKVLARPETTQLVAAARARCLSPAPIAFVDDPGVLVEWYPARVGLPGLAADPRLVGAGRSPPTFSPGRRPRPTRWPGSSPTSPGPSRR